MANFFSFAFLYPPHQIKQIHESYCTEVLQSANIMNWHKLVYTFHFLDDKNDQKACLFFFNVFFVQSGSIFMVHKLKDSYSIHTGLHQLRSNENIRLCCSHITIKGVLSTQVPPCQNRIYHRTLSRSVKRKRKKV